MASCINTFETLAGRNPNHLTPQLPGLAFSAPPFFPSASPGLQNKRKSVSDLGLASLDASRKRRTPGLDVQRSIQPKPAANGSPISFASPFQGQTPKKRGRPSKNDLRIRQAEEVARGEILGSLETSKGSTSSPIPSSGDLSMATLLSVSTNATMGQESESSPIASFIDQADSSEKKRSRTTKSSDVC